MVHVAIEARLQIAEFVLTQLGLPVSGWCFFVRSVFLHARLGLTWLGHPDAYAHTL